MPPNNEGPLSSRGVAARVGPLRMNAGNDGIGSRLSSATAVFVLMIGTAGILLLIHGARTYVEVFGWMFFGFLASMVVAVLLLRPRST